MLENPENIRKGRCLCSAITIQVTGQPTHSFLCHCRDCQRSAGGPCQVVGVFPSKKVTITTNPSDAADTPLKSYVLPGTETFSGKPKEKLFCGRCGCTVATVPAKWNGEVMVVRTALLEEGMEVWPPTEEWFVKDRPGFVGDFHGTERIETIPAAASGK